MKRLLPFIIIAAPLLFNCTHYYYVPNIQNVPLFREKDEFRISASYGGGDESNSFELQGAWSAGKHVGLTSSFLSSNGHNSNNYDEWGKGSYIDLACGYYTPINEHGVFEVYGGIGAASQKHQYYQTTYSASGKASLKSNRFFIQPAIGFEFKAFEFAFSTRFCRLSFTDVDFSHSSDLDEWEISRLQTLSDDGVFYFVEPAGTVRVGWENVKIQVQVSLGSYQWSSEIPFEPYHVGLGVQFAFGNRYKTDSDK
jgi:hypothetical protein